MSDEYPLHFAGVPGWNKEIERLCNLKSRECPCCGERMTEESFGVSGSYKAMLELTDDEFSKYKKSVRDFLDKELYIPVEIFKPEEGNK